MEIEEHESERDEFVGERLERLTFLTLSRSWVAFVIVIVSMFYFLNGNGAFGPALVFSAFAVALILARVLLSRSYVASHDSSSHRDWYQKRFLALSLSLYTALSLLFGYVSFHLDPQSAYIAGPLIALSGLAGMFWVVGSLIISQLGLLTFCWPVAAGLALNSEVPLILSLLIFLFTIPVSIVGRQAHFTQRSLFEREFDNIRLINQQEKQMIELEEARQAADEANAAKSSFLAHASHDLRQPLHAIGLFLESLPEEYDDNRTGHAMSRVRESHRQLSDLFDTLLDVSVIDIGEVEVKMTDFALGKLLSQIVAEFQPLAAQNGLRIRHVRTEAWVHADPQLLGRMIRNLLSNALRYGGGQNILIGCRRRDGKLAVEVVDRGHGLSEEELSRAFSEFTRLRRKEDGQSVPGFGLGLTIVARLADLQKLSVAVRSDPGRGSQFQINGLLLASRAQAISQTDPEPSPDAAQTRVLVIDDDPKVLDATRALLEKWNFAVEVGDSLDPERQNAPDILVCDYELSDQLDGFQVVAAARAAYGAHLPAIMISGTTDESLARRADQAGLPLRHKPVRPAQLRSALLHAGQGKH